MDPRPLDFGRFARSEERDPARSTCGLPRMEARDRLRPDTPTVATRPPPPPPPPPSFALRQRGAEYNVGGNLDVGRDPDSFPRGDLPGSSAADESRMGITGDGLTARAVRAGDRSNGFGGPLPSDIARVLEELIVPGGGGVTATGTRHPDTREEQPHRSPIMVNTNSVCVDASSTGHSTDGRRNPLEGGYGQRTVTILRPASHVPESRLNADVAADVRRSPTYDGGLQEAMSFRKSGTISWSAFPEKKELPENRGCRDVDGGGSNVAGSGGSQPLKPNTSAGLGRAQGSSGEEPAGDAAVQAVHLGRNNTAAGLRYGIPRASLQNCGHCRIHASESLLHVRPSCLLLARPSTSLRL